MSVNKKIALLQANSGSTYYLAKILYKKGYTVHILHHQKHIIEQSKYINSFKLITSPFEDLKQSAQDVLNLNLIEKYDLIIPINDVALEICSLLKNKLANLLQLNTSKSDQFRDKIKLWSLAKQQGIPSIEGNIISSIEEYELNRGNYSLPVVTKTRKSSESINNRVHKFSVRKCITTQQLDNFIHDNINNSNILIQKTIPGFGAGFNFFSINGKLISYYAHQRITEQGGAGVSSLRKTIDANQYNLLVISSKLINEMNWTGIGMLEYRIYNDEAYIIELNGRPWGSMMLGEKSGCNPITDFIDWKLNGRLPQSIAYKSNTYCCRLKDDLKNQIVKVKYEGIKNIPIWILGLFRYLYKNYNIEDIDIQDKKYTFKYWIPQAKARVNTPVVDYFKTISIHDKICFVCHGNINRSPFAEAVFKERFPNIACISTGIINISNRMASRQAVMTSQLFKIDLSKHKSSYINEHDLKNWKLVVMDDQNIQNLLKLGYKENIVKIDQNDISDPHGCEDLTYNQSFNQIYKLIYNVKLI